MSDRARRLVKTAIVASLLAVTAALLLPAFTGRPVVSYASSASMEPTIGVLDVFFVDPWPDRLGVGDIIVFESVTQGGPAVHRIVGGDAQGGWLTQGDANAGLDQLAGEPPVTSDRVLGRVIARDGAPLLLDDGAVPYLEARAELVQLAAPVGGPRMLLALGFLAVAVVAGLAGAASRPLPARLSPRARRALRRAFPRGVLGRHLGYALLALLLVSTAWGAAHARTDVPIQMVVVQDPLSADGIRAAARGGTLDHTLAADALPWLPTLVVLEPASERVRVEGARHVVAAPGGNGALVATQLARDVAGLQDDVVQVWRYPAVLPADAMLALHDAAPGAPYFAVALVFALAGGVLFTAMGIARLPVGRLLGLREDWR